MRKPAVHMIGNTHFDPVWLWTWDEGMASVRSTIRSALARMDEDPDFRYSFSCPPAFRWIEETEPAMFEEIRRRVAEGRFCLDEGMWLQPDCYSASGESYVRQCLYGQNYLKRTFGVRSDTAFNADCFGAPGMLPQILVKSGIPYAVFGRPDNADLPLSDPYFAWSSPDGSTVAAYRITDAASPWSRDVSAEIDRALEYGGRTGNDSMIVFGVTDHGGAPTKRDIAVIREKAREQAENARILFSSTGDFFRACRDAGRVPKDTVGEIPIRFFGVFSDLPNIKKRNREAEYACLLAERAAVLDRILSGTPVPLKKLNSCWEDVLFNQFHDILGGSSIRDAYDDAEARYGHAIHEAKTLLHAVLQRVTARMDLTADGETDWNLAVWNLHAFPVCEPIEAEVQWAWEFDWYRGEICVLDEQGREIPCQLLQAREAIPGFRSRFVFRAEIPPFGYRVFRVRRRGSSAVLPYSRIRVAQEEDCLAAENDFVRLTVDRNTGSVSLADRKTGRIVRQTGEILKDESDVWAFNFTGYGEREAFRVESVKLIEDGDWRVRIRVRSVYGMSSLEQDFLLYRDSGEVECRYCLNWREIHRTCKFRFDMPLSGGEEPQITASSPYGTAERPLDGKEKPVGPFLILREENGGGFTLLSDCLFAYHAQTDEGNAAVSMTAVRSPIWGDLRTEPLNPDWQYEGIGEGVIRGKWRLRTDPAEPSVGSLWNEADAFLCPPVVVDEACHGGDLPMRRSFAAVERVEMAERSEQTERAECTERAQRADGIRMTVVKPAEDGSDDVILRLLNPDAAPSGTKVRLFGREAEFSLAPYEILTVRWGEKPETVDLLEEKTE